MRKPKQLPNGWQELLPAGDEWKLPESFERWAKGKDIYRSNHGSIYRIFYKGDPETTDNWIAVTPDGWYYKVRAEYMVWSNTCILARWSDASLRKLLRALFEEVASLPFDPNYHT